MIKRILTILSVAVLMFGFAYLAWQHGRYIGSNERGDYYLTNCKPLEGDEEFECDIFEMNTPELKQVYEEVLKELREPTKKRDWNNKYKEWQEKRINL